MARVIISEYTIISITSATPGWRALYDDGDCAPIACWALISLNTGHRCVVGMADSGPEGMMPAEEASNFKSYLGPTE